MSIIKLLFLLSPVERGIVLCLFAIAIIIFLMKIKSVRIESTKDKTLIELDFNEK